MRRTRYLILLVSLAILGTTLGLAATPEAKPRAKDTVAIDPKNYELWGFPSNKTSTRSDEVHIRLNVKYSLTSQPKGYLRAAINLDGDLSFRSVFASEVRQGSDECKIEVVITKPELRIFRVIVWIDSDGATAAPHPVASDNIAFAAAQFKAFLNINDR